MSFDTGIPNIRVVVREATDENLTVDLPNVAVTIDPGSSYNVNLIPNTVTTLRTGSFNTYADFAGIATTASFALTTAAGTGFPFSGSAVITGSLLVSQSGLQVQGNQIISASNNQTSSLNIAHTWSGSGVTYNSIKLNVTDTTSAVLSNLIDLQVGGSSKFLVGKTGRIDTQADIRVFGSGAVRINNNSGYFSLGAADDVVLNRDASDILAQRRTTNPQTFRIYNTFTDLSNFERATLRWTANAFFFGTEVSGSGTASGRSLNFTSANGFINSDSHFVPSNTRAKDLGVAAALWRDIFVGRTINVDQGIITTNLPLISGSTTWNSGSVTFTGIKLNIIDSASNAASSLVDLQISGSSRFQINKAGGIVFNVSSSSNTNPQINLSGSSKLYTVGAFTWLGGNGQTGILDNDFYLGSNSDLILTREATDTLAQRRTTNSQTFRIYNTFTNVTNYERGILQWSGSVFNIGTEHSGSAFARALSLQTSGSTRLFITPTGNIGIGTNNPTTILTLGTSDPVISFFQPDSTYSLSRTGTTMQLNSAGQTTVTSGFGTTLETRDGAVVVRTGTGTGTSERMRITSSGSVGIGTTSPNALFQVQGNQIISASSTQPSSLDIAHTWNNSGTTYNSIKLNVTDTTSAAASNLMNLQVGGTSQFSVSKIGLVTANNIIIGAVNGSSLGNNIIAGPSSYIGFGSSYGSDVPGNVGDTRLFRDSASVFAQRNGTNPQTFRIYNTFTDLSNFERGILQWSSNVLNMGTEHSGSGSPRRLNFIGNGISFASINANPATEVWRFNGSGHFVAGTDNTYDIGTSGALRPRHIYVAQLVNFGGSARISAAAAGALLIENNTGTSFDRLMFGGTTSTFPSLKRSGSAIQVRLADDSGDGGFTAGATTISGIQNNTDTTNSTFWNNGALTVAGGVGIGRDVNISGSVNILGLLTVVSQSTQYVTASQLIVADNKIIVNVSDLQRFGGLSVVDSGSTSPTTASIYWDSLNHHFIYENLSGSAYNSAMFIAGPVNTGTLGNEAGLTIGRVPVASGTDHIDSRIQSSSIRVDFPSRLTHIESGLVVTGSVTSSGDVIIQGVLYTSGSNTDVDPTTEVIATVPSSSYDAAFFDYVIKKSTNYRAGTVTAVWDKNGNIEHMDNSTNDLGSTAEVVLSLDSSGGNIRLIATVATNDWTVKSSVRAL